MPQNSEFYGVRNYHPKIMQIQVTFGNSGLGNGVFS